MPMYIASVAELLPQLPCKREVDGQKLVLFVGGGSILCKQVIMDTAWQLDVGSLAQMEDPSLVALCTTTVANDAVWVDLNASEKKKSEFQGFGLGCFQGQSSAVPVPEPWMGTYGEKLPVIPMARGGIEWQRVHGKTEGHATKQRPQKQQTLSSMFGGPLKVEEMDF